MNITNYSFKHRYDVLSTAYVVGAEDPALALKDLQEAFRLATSELQSLHKTGNLGTLAHTARLRDDFVCKHVKHPERLAAVRLKAPTPPDEKARRLMARADAVLKQIQHLEQAEALLPVLRAKHAKLMTRLD